MLNTLGIDTSEDGLESLLQLLGMLASASRARKQQQKQSAQGPMGGAQPSPLGGGNAQPQPQPAGFNPRDSYRRNATEPVERAPQDNAPDPEGSVKASSLSDPRGSPPAAAKPDVKTEAKFIDQFDSKRVARAGKTACYRAVQSMARTAGVQVPDSTANRIQVATGEDRSGHVRTDPQRTQQARDYIDRQLDAGRPVAVGVSYKGGYQGNRDGVTDHFVLVNGRGTDAQGRQYYTYHDPSTTHPSKGKDNRFYVDPNNGNLVHAGKESGKVIDRRKEMSMVVLSDGTSRPPARPLERAPAAQDPAPAANDPAPANGTPPLLDRGNRDVARAYRDYQQKFSAGLGRTTRPGEAAKVAKKLDEPVTVNGRVTTRRQLVDEIGRKANLPPAVVAGIWYREDSRMRTDRYLHNGQRLGRRTTQVPRGIFFRKDQFVEAATHALKQKRAAANQLGLNYRSTDRAAMAAFAERYNGFGYRHRGRASAYVTAGTNLYHGGMYVADGRYSPRAVDRRLGVLPVIDAIMGR